MKILLTGGHTGIGLELSKRLVKDGHHLGLIIRTPKRKAEVENALGELLQVDFFYADLSKQAEVVRVAADIREKWDQIDVLFNNAGVLLDKAYFSEQGNEMHFEVNTLAPYLLTQQLRPLLDHSDSPKVINTVTAGMHRQKELDIPELKKPTKFKKLIGSYMSSKMALTLLMNHLAASWPQGQVVSVNPGPNKTNMTKGSGMPGWLLPLRNLLFPPASKGGKILYQSAFDPAFQGKSGIYLSGGKARDLKFKLSQEQVSELEQALKV